MYSIYWAGHFHAVVQWWKTRWEKLHYGSDNWASTIRRNNNQMCSFPGCRRRCTDQTVWVFWTFATVQAAPKKKITAEVFQIRLKSPSSFCPWCCCSAVIGVYPFLVHVIRPICVCVQKHYLCAIKCTVIFLLFQRPYSEGETSTKKFCAFREHWFFLSCCAIFPYLPLLVF